MTGPRLAPCGCCGERGPRVPEGAAVVGFDGMLRIAGQTDAPLTTFRQSIEGMGRTMARLLLRGQGRGTATGEPDERPGRLSGSGCRWAVPDSV
jgi:DNA-binding LacI/PurR family transcriptional regulator